MYCANAYFGMDRIFAVISVTLEHLALWIESDPANVLNSNMNFKNASPEYMDWRFFIGSPNPVSNLTPVYSSRD